MTWRCQHLLHHLAEMYSSSTLPIRWSWPLGIHHFHEPLALHLLDHLDVSSDQALRVNHPHEWQKNKVPLADRPTRKSATDTCMSENTLKYLLSLCFWFATKIFFQLSNTCHRLMSWKTAPGERLTSAPRFWRTFASHKSHEDVSSRIIVRLRWAKLTPKDVLNLY